MNRRPKVVTIATDPACQDAADWDEWMEFRLTYEGLLFGASRSDTRARHKHEIRCVFHKQLKRLFEVHPAFFNVQPTSSEELQAIADRGAIQAMFSRAEGSNRHFNRLEEFERCGYHFFPLATRELSLLCSIQILFLRPDAPGSVIQSGDIDNRMKTIFDALRLPRNASELGGYDVPGDGEDPFFCLLEDDSLINHAAIEADTLLQPTGASWERNDARLIVTVRLSPYQRVDEVRRA
jgi:hypothetical protein